MAPDTFPAGNWGSGMEIDGHGAAPGKDVQISLGSTFSLVEAGPTVKADENGDFSVDWTPTAYAVSGENVGYIIIANQAAADGQDADDAFSATQEITITEGAAADFPEKSSLADIADPGMSGTFSGFQPGETVTASLWVNGNDGNGLVEVDSSSDPATADGDGAGSIAIASTGDISANANVVVVRLKGSTSGNFTQSYVQIPAATLELDQDTFAAGDWADGLKFSGSTRSQADVQVTLEALDQDGDVVDSEDDPETSPVGEDGTFSGSWTPSMVLEYGSDLLYRVDATQTLENGETVDFPSVYLTVEAPYSATFPEEVTPEQLKSGITGTFTGFTPGSTLNTVVWAMNDGDYEQVPATAKDVTADDKGAGSITVASDKLVAAGTELSIGLYNDADEQVFVPVKVVAAAEAPTTPGDSDDPAADKGGDDAPAADTGDAGASAPAASGDTEELAATGSETVAPLALTVLLLVGGAVLLLIRRRKPAQR